MRTITAPEPFVLTQPSIFLAGGISNCPLWQEEALEFLSDLDVDVVNPRREGILESTLATEQILWEHDALQRVDAIMFWFPEETLCPITLFELGVHLGRDVPLFIGTHPGYQRRHDVKIQVGLVRPDLTIHSRLTDVFAEAAEKLTGRS